MKKYLVLSVLVLLSIAIFTLFNLSFSISYQADSQLPQLRQEQQIFKQLIDHFDYSSSALFSQRYWVVQDYFDPAVGPVFLYICGQNVCNGVPQSRTWIVSLAKQFKGLVLVLEHRFYGKSLPFGKDSFSLKNMALLNSEQALSDLAYFIQKINAYKMYHVDNNPWITVGGSYAGALSAWFRYKYPHLAIGALSSSGVVNVMQDYYQMDEQVYISSQISGQYCTQALNTSVNRVEQILYSSESEAQKFKLQFSGAQKLSNQEFLFFWADTIVLTIQYGGRSMICGQLKGKNAQQQFQVMLQNAKKFPVQEYGAYYLTNQTLAYETMNAARPWYYQYCTEFGWFQTFSPKHPMRSKRIDLYFFSRFCENAYGKGTWPKSNRKNNEYGALNLKATNIIFSNGIEDTCRWASLQENKDNRFVVQVIDCPNCAHCVDLQTPSPNDSDALKNARNQQIQTIGQWIEDYYKKLNQVAFQNSYKNK